MKMFENVCILINIIQIEYEFLIWKEKTRAEGRY